MILGVDHVALSCADVAAAAAGLAASGYTVRFAQEDVPNRESKAHLLTRYQPLHAIAYCQGTAGVAIELTQHGPLPEGPPSPYAVLLHGPLAPSEFGEDARDWRSQVWRETLGCAEPQSGRWLTANAPYCYDGAARLEPGVRAILLPVSDLERSVQFWKTAMGCRVRSRSAPDADRSWILLSFRTPVPAWCLEVVLVQQPPPEPYALDARGFPCVAALTTSLEADLAAALQAGASESTGTFEVFVNGKTLTVAVFRGPDGELLELIEIRREAR